jgi:hypothetical protein
MNFQEFAQPKLYTLTHKEDFRPRKFKLPADVVKYIGEGAESFVFTSNVPNSPVYKIAKDKGSNRNPAEILAHRQENVDGIHAIESKGSIIIPDHYMHWGTYLHQDKPPQPKEAYYDKETKSWTIDKEYPIKVTNTTMLTGGIIKQDQIIGKPIDRELYMQLEKILKRNGFFVDFMGGRSNIRITDTGELAFIDGIHNIGK